MCTNKQTLGFELMTNIRIIKKNILILYSEINRGRK